MTPDCDYLVAIRCSTFNQAAFITDALNGFVIQQTNFPFIAIIVDDASIDGEKEIINTFVDEQFDFTKKQWESDEANWTIARHKKNVNCNFLFVSLKKNLYKNPRKGELTKEWFNRVKYIALCEGDDYWTDPLKLQKQVDYMDYHPDCTLSVHSADWLTGDETYPGGCQESASKDYSVEELIRCGGLFFATASFVFRSELNEIWPEWRRKAGVGDFPLQILAGLYGKVHYLPDKMCVYRYLSLGSWTSTVQKPDIAIAFLKNKINWMRVLDEDTDHKYQRAIYSQLFQHYNSLFNLREIGFWEYAKSVQKSGNKRYGRLLKDFCRLYLTPVYSILKLFNKEHYV